MPKELLEVIKPKKEELWWIYHPESDSLFMGDINNMPDDGLCEGVQKLSRKLLSVYKAERAKINKKLKLEQD